MSYDLRDVTINYTDGSGNGPDPANPHPDRKVLALIHDGALVTESAAVATYLADLASEARLAPRIGDPGRGAYLTWISWVGGEFGPAIFQRLAADADAPEPPAVTAALQRVEHALAAGSYLLGERFSAADVMLGGTLGWARHILPADGAAAAYLAVTSGSAPPAFWRRSPRSSCPARRRSHRRCRGSRLIPCAAPIAFSRLSSCSAARRCR